MLLPPLVVGRAALGVSVRHRQPRPLHPVAAHLWRARRADGRGRRRRSARCCSAPRWRCSPAISAAGSIASSATSVDLWMSLPPVVLSLTLMVGFGTGLGNVILAIVLVDWTRFCRVVRSEVMVVRAPRLCRRRAAARLRALAHHPARNPAGVAPLIITLFTLEVGIGIIVEAILSFVGLSVGRRIPGLGQDDRGRAQLHVPGAVGPHPADPRHVHHRARLQSARRRAAGRARSAAAARASALSVLLERPVTVTAPVGGRRVDVLRDLVSRWRRAGECSGWSANPAPARA